MNETLLAAQLRSIGLSEKESMAYTWLVLHDGGYPAKVADGTGLNRSTTYQVLFDLSVKGLVQEVRKGKKKFFRPEHPRHVLSFAKDQLKLATQREEKAKTIVPELESLLRLSGNRPEVIVLEGPDALKKVCEDFVAEKRYEMVAFSNGTLFRKMIPSRFLRWFVDQKVKNQITTRGILPDTVEDRNYAKHVFRGVPKKFWPAMRFADSEAYRFDAELTVYGSNKISLVKLTGTQVIGVIIKDEAIHKMMRMIFDVAWAGARK